MIVVCPGAKAEVLWLCYRAPEEGANKTSDFIMGDRCLFPVSASSQCGFLLTKTTVVVFVLKPNQTDKKIINFLNCNVVLNSRGVSREWPGVATPEIWSATPLSVIKLLLLSYIIGILWFDLEDLLDLL